MTLRPSPAGSGAHESQPACHSASLPATSDRQHTSPGSRLSSESLPSSDAVTGPPSRRRSRLPRLRRGRRAARASRSSSASSDSSMSSRPGQRTRLDCSRWSLGSRRRSSAPAHFSSGSRPKQLLVVSAFVGGQHSIGSPREPLDRSHLLRAPRVVRVGRQPWLRSGLRNLAEYLGTACRPVDDHVAGRAHSLVCGARLCAAQYVMNALSCPRCPVDRQVLLAPVRVLAPRLASFESDAASARAPLPALSLDGSGTTPSDDPTWSDRTRSAGLGTGELDDGGWSRSLTKTKTGSCAPSWTARTSVVRGFGGGCSPAAGFFRPGHRVAAGSGRLFAGGSD